MNRPTENQRHALSRIIAVRDMQRARMLADYPGCKPSYWVNVHQLVTIHKVNRGAIKALVKKGFLLERPSGGWGPEVLVIESQPLSNNDTGGKHEQRPAAPQ